MGRRRRARRTEAGMTLIEVLVATGILAGVIVSVASLFVLGGQRVKSGREMSEGTAVAGEILESMQKLGYTQMVTIFPSCPDPTTVTVCTVNSQTDAFASAQWQGMIDQALWQGEADITLTAVGAGGSLDAAEGIRIQIRMSWQEGPNQRSVELETVRF